MINLDAARKIHQSWSTNLKKTVKEINAKERQRLLTIADAGAGISGIESTAVLAYFVRKDTEKLGLDPNTVRTNLIITNTSLLSNGPARVGLKLGRSLDARGVTILHSSRVLQEKEGTLTLSIGKKMPVGLCVLVQS